MEDPEVDLAAQRQRSLGLQLASGDETDLISIGIYDLGLPASTRAVCIKNLVFPGSLREVGRTPDSDDSLLLEYDVDVLVEVDATLSEADALERRWQVKELLNGLAVVQTELARVMRAGVKYEDPDDVSGYIEYIGIRD